MPVLSQHAKKEKDPYTFPVMSRLPDEIGKAFSEYCHKYNLTIAEGIRILIENELKASGHMPQDRPGSPAAASNIAHDVSAAAPVEKAAAATERIEKDMAPKKAASTKTRKGFVIKFVSYDGMGAKVLPCPICKDWYSYSTFSKRHAKAHGYENTEQFFLAHENEVKKMHADKTGKKI